MSRSEAVGRADRKDKQEYINKFCGVKVHPGVFPKDAKCDIKLGPLEERCDTCGLITATGWLTEFLEQQDSRIKELEEWRQKLTQLQLIPTQKKKQ